MRAPTIAGLALLIIVAVGSGCANTGSGLLGWWTQRGERQVQKAEARVTVAEADLLARVQRSVEEFRAALRLAPPSRAVAVATEAGDQAGRHLGQLLGPLTAGRLAEIDARAAALVSEDAATRAPAEAARAADRRADYAAAEQVGELRTKLTAAEDKAHAIAEKNAELAALYLKARWAAALAGAATVLATGIGIYLKIAGGNGAQAVAEILAKLDVAHPAAATLARAAADTPLWQNQQAAIFDRVARLAAQERAARAESTSTTVQS